MTTGLQWQEDVPYDDPRSDSSLMEATNDWVQYVIDKPMAAEPGKVWNYSSGVTELLAYIFQKETGQDIDDYGQKYLFAPLGIRHEWKRTYQGVVDTEGGLYLNGSDLAKIGYLYLHDGMWDGQRIVSSEWVKESVTPYFQTDDPPFKYGFKWWLSKLPDSTEYVWMARGFGGQNLLVFPNESLIVTFTAWDMLPTSTGKEPVPSDFLPIVKIKSCTSAADGHPSTSEKQQVSKQGTQNPEAYALYSKGRSYLTSRPFRTLKRQSPISIKPSPKTPATLWHMQVWPAPMAHYLTTVTSRRRLPKAKAAARKAMELDPTLASPHVSLGGTMMAHNWDFAGGEAEFKKGLELTRTTHAHEIVCRQSEYDWGRGAGSPC